MLFVMAANNLEEYLYRWLSGLRDEILFWNDYIQGIGAPRLNITSDPKRRFTLEEELPEDPGQVVKFVDVGSGAFSRCGLVTDKVKLDILAVDPLAEVYKILKQKYNRDNGIRLETGFVELLDRKFEKNSFDMVHMSNSLDHCFDPVFGLYQLLNICKIGGKVILRHAENEAERNAYSGLHQWNLSLRNPEHSFVIWRPDARHDICKLFSEWASVRLYPDVTEAGGTWVHNVVIMEKKADIPIPENDYYENMLMVMYDWSIRNLLAGVFPETPARDEKALRNKRLCAKLDKLAGGWFPGVEKQEGVIIYGAGMVGQKVFDICRKVGADVKAIIDRRDFTYQGYRMVSPASLIAGLESTPIIVTVPAEYSQIKETLHETGWKNVWSLEDLLQARERDN